MSCPALQPVLELKALLTDALRMLAVLRGLDGALWSTGFAGPSWSAAELCEQWGGMVAARQQQS